MAFLQIQATLGTAFVSCKGLMRHVHNLRKRQHLPWVAKRHLGLPLSVAEFDEVWTQKQLYSYSMDSMGLGMRLAGMCVT